MAPGIPFSIFFGLIPNGLLASGYIDLVVEADLKIYDVMALVPVVENAGGVITDWQGNNSFNEGWDGCLVAAASDGAGIVTGILNIDGRDVAFYGHDFTVRAGSIDATNGSNAMNILVL